VSFVYERTGVDVITRRGNVQSERPRNRKEAALACPGTKAARPDSSSSEVKKMLLQSASSQENNLAADEVERGNKSN
jgi:hypothetical protein